ncbi:Hypothetical predicted protein [Podarcis lilfordi]|uniref:Uncharacterized protein n=1 Tax=Podarcis lilfordi TaxID=74358 RepID=A0AA35P998_9SAUR|nr:Hypothetical predicted protein [Podarcis lilfordi]
MVSPESPFCLAEVLLSEDLPVCENCYAHARGEGLVLWWPHLSQVFSKTSITEKAGQPSMPEKGRLTWTNSAVSRQQRYLEWFQKTSEEPCWIRPKAHLLQHPIFAAANHVPTESLQAEGKRNRNLAGKSREICTVRRVICRFPMAHVTYLFVMSGL